MKCQLAKGVGEFYLLLPPLQELSFKCWDNLMTTPADS